MSETSASPTSLRTRVSTVLFESLLMQKGINGEEKRPALSQALVRRTSTLFKVEKKGLAVGPLEDSSNDQGLMSSSEGDIPEWGEFRSYGDAHLYKWVRTRGEAPVDTPQISIPGVDLGVADVLIHSHGKSQQIFVMELEGASLVWKVAGVGYSHPTISKRCLNLKGSGDPSWVLRDSLNKYRVDTKKGKLPAKAFAEGEE